MHFVTVVLISLIVGVFMALASILLEPLHAEIINCASILPQCGVPLSDRFVVAE